MTAPEQGFLLLTGFLGNPHRNPLTTAQLRNLAKRSRTMKKPTDDRQMTEADLVHVGYSYEDAARILALLSERELLEVYLRRGKQCGCVPITRISAGYPARLWEQLGDDCPGCLWGKGDLKLLGAPCVSLVGSRELHRENLLFAEAVGREAAVQGYVLVSGNARGADTAAQEACLAEGGSVISVVADSLERLQLREQVLYLSEDGFDLPFSSGRALSRNRIIHCLSQCVLVAQSDLGHGGTWSGTRQNLRCGWSNVCCFSDGSPAATHLVQMGAVPVSMQSLKDISVLSAKYSFL